MSNPGSLAWHYLVDLSLQHYAAGRFAALNRLHRVAPNLLHHAVELILKAALARDHSLDTLKCKYGHDLQGLWQTVTEVNPSLKTAPRDQAIVALGKFEALRYPDLLISQGASISISFESGKNPTISGSRPSSGPRYEFNLEDIDELWATLFHNSGANPAAFLQHLSAGAREALEAQNRHTIQSLAQSASS